MMTLIRGSALLLVITIGFAGLYGSSASPCREGVEISCDLPRGTGGGGGGTETIPVTPTPAIPTPVVSINDRGVGLAAYAQGGSLIVRRFNGAAGFEAPLTVASGVEEDVAVAIGGSQARLAWRAENGRVAVLSGDDTGTFPQPQMDVATSGADDPVIASDQHSTTASHTFVAWRLGTTQSNGFPATAAYGSSSLLAPYPLLSRYSNEEDVAVNSLFDLRVATSGPRAMAVWIAQQRSDSSIAHVYVSRLADSLWSDARRLGTTVGGEPAAVGMDVDGNALVIWAQSGGVFYSRYLAATDSWSEPAVVRSELTTLGQMQIDVAPNGRAIAAWTMTNGGVWSAEYDVITGRWIDIHRLDLDGATNSLNGRDPRVAIDGVGRAIVVWRGDGRAYANEHERTSGWTLPELLGSTASTLDLDVDNDGLGVAVWWQDGLQSRIWNRAGAPNASFTFEPDPGVAGHVLFFNAQASSGPFPIANYEWDWENDGAFEGGGSTPTHAFENAGTFTTRLRITDSAAQTATTTRTINIAPLGELSSRVIVNYAGPGDGSIEIHSAQPGFSTVQCGTSTPPGQETDTGTCEATVLAGYDITIVAEYDPVRSIFSGWPEGRGQCSRLASSTAPGGTRAECRFAATSQDRGFEVSFAIAPPATHILRIELNPSSQGSGSIVSSPTLVSCTVQNQLILNSTGGQCSYSIGPGDTITLFAHPMVGFFISWQGCDSQPANNQCTVTMTGLRTVTARFGGG